MSDYAIEKTVEEDGTKTTRVEASDPSIAIDMFHEIESTFTKKDLDLAAERAAAMVTTGEVRLACDCGDDEACNRCAGVVR